MTHNGVQEAIKKNPELSTDKNLLTRIRQGMTENQDVVDVIMRSPDVKKIIQELGPDNPTVGRNLSMEFNGVSGEQNGQADFEEYYERKAQQLRNGDQEEYTRGKSKVESRFKTPDASQRTLKIKSTPASW